jgi:hypothetical protein
VRHRTIPLLSLVLAAVALSACGTTPATQTSQPPRTGAVVGNLLMDVGVQRVMQQLPGTNGTVTFTKQNAPQTTRILRVSSSGHFSARIPLGTWVVTGRSPKFGGNKYQCQGSTHSITVAASHRTSVSVLCEGD